jgi:phosphoglycerate dehydrogenase-like enzyme
VIASTDPFDHSVFARCPNLRVIARTGVGVDAIDLGAASSAGVVVATTPGANEETVADHTLALMLTLVRRMAEHDASVRAGKWERAGELTPGDMCGATVGLIGSGVIGSAVARRIRAFGSRLLIADPALTAVEGGEIVDLDTLLRESDVVSIHVPFLAATRGMIGTDQLAVMKPNAILINASRGGIIDEAALVHGLRSGTIAAAGLDVFEREPPVNSELLGLPNVILSPHIGGLSTRAIDEMCRRATDSVLTVLDGRIPADAVNGDQLMPRQSHDS